MKKAVCSGYYGFDNFGDDAVLSVLVNLFSKKYDLTVFSASPEKTKKIYNVKSVNSFNYFEVLKSIIKSDVLISGGGSLLQDATSFKSLIYYLGIIFIAELFFKEVIIFAQGLGPFNSKFSELLVKTLLKRCKLITVRDIDSKRLLENWNIKSALVCDPVFTMNITKQKKENTLGIQLRKFCGVNDEFLKKLAAAVNNYFPDKNIVIFSLQPSIDLDVCLKFKDLLRRDAVVKNGLSVPETLEEISKLEYLIGMRFHALLAGLMSGVKVLPVSYDKKVTSLALEAGVEYVELSNLKHLEEKVKMLKNAGQKNLTGWLNSKRLDVNIFDI